MLTSEKINRVNNFLYFILFAMILFYLQWDLVLHDPLLLRDDPNLIAPIAQLNHFLDYFSLVFSAKLKDIQPIRDFSYFIDVMITSLVGRSFYHLHNLLIGLGIGYFLIKLIALSMSSKRKFQRLWPLIFMIIYFHPSIQFTLSWIAARKHLLSSFFILWSTYLWEIGEKENEWNTKKLWKIVLLYTLSIFSQPITLLWPIWCLLTTKRKFNKKILLPLSLLTVSGLICSGANIYYYWILTPDKFLPHLNGWDQVVRALSAIGRSFYQLILPVNISATYSEIHIFNFLGLLGLFSFMVVIWRSRYRNDLFKWLSFLLFPLILVNLKSTNIFVSDTYLVIPAIGFSILFIKLLLTRKRWTAQVILMSLISFSIYKSALVTRMFQTDQLFWSISYQQDSNAYNGLHLAQKLVQFHPEQSFQIMSNTIKDNPDWKNKLPFDQRAVVTTFAKALHRHRGLTKEEKLKTFADINMPDPWYRYFWATTFWSNDLFEEGYKIIKDDLLQFYFGSQTEIVSAETGHFCKRLSRTVGTCEKFNKWVKEAIKNNLLDKGRFQKRLNELDKL